MRCGLTPTDIMHIKGDFSVYDTEASRLAAQFVLKCLYADADSSVQIRGTPMWPTTL